MRETTNGHGGFFAVCRFDTLQRACAFHFLQHEECKHIMSVQQNNRPNPQTPSSSQNQEREPMPHRLRGLPRHVYEEVRELFREQRSRSRN